MEVTAGHCWLRWYLPAMPYFRRRWAGLPTASGIRRGHHDLRNGLLPRPAGPCRSLLASLHPADCRLPDSRRRGRGNLYLSLVAPGKTFSGQKLIMINALLGLFLVCRQRGRPGGQRLVD